jgi:tetratricopeptide (TPR) repeat protein
MNCSFSTTAYLLLVACSAAPTPATREAAVPPAPSAERADLARARTLTDAGQFDDALLITDAALERDRSDRDALLIAADANLGLFDEGRAPSAIFLADATNCLQRALALDNDDPETWMRLADLRLRQGDFTAGKAAGLRAADLLRERRADPQAVCRAVLLGAENEMQMFVAARRDEIARGVEIQESTAQQAKVLLARLESIKPYTPGPAYLRCGQVYSWVGDTVQAYDELERGIEAVPGDAALNDALQLAYAQSDRHRECVGAYKRQLERHPDSAPLRWHMGRAQVALGDAEREQGRHQQADRAYADAAATFAEYRELRPEHAANTDHWRAICDLARGKLALDAGDVEAAAAQCAAAWSDTPRVAEQDADGLPIIADSFGVGYLNLVDGIARRLVERSDRASMTAALAFYDAVIARHPDRFGFLYNNAALTARDLGVAVQKSGDAAAAEEAMALWEKSYAYYRKAVELSPDDARIANDCGLMLVYHLHRDHERARWLFDRAIEIGERQLAELPAEAADEERRDLEEAVGDAYQNIGIMLREEAKAPDEYRPFFERAVRYYPYQAREAARGLERRAAQDPQKPAPSAAMQRVKAEAEAKAQMADFDGALLVLDAAAHELREQAEFHYLVGKYSLAYAGQVQGRARSGQQVLGLEEDAVRELQRAVEIDGEAVQPRLELARAYLQTGKFPEASDEADRLLAHLRSLGESSADAVTASHRVRATASARVYIEGKQNGTPDDAQLERARASFRQLADAGAMTTADLDVWIALEQWADNAERAVEVLLALLVKQPDSLDLLGRAVDTAEAAGLGARVVAALADRTDAAGVWYRGRARFDAAREHVRLGQNQEALAQLDAAMADFRAAKEGNAEYGPSSDEWIGLCLGARGTLRLAMEDYAKATADLLAAARQAPARIGDDLGNGSSIKAGVLRVADVFFRENDLERTELVFRRAAEAVPTDSDFLNNHGLFARDLGTALERAGDSEGARAMYEASYASYTKAAEVEPDSLRLQNDRALLLIYHLQRDLPLAKSLLEDAIARGEARLATDPPADPEARRDLQEAIGDCYQNLGVYLDRYDHDVAAARAALEKSLTFYPFEQRESTQHLRRLQEQGSDHLDDGAGKDSMPK